MKILYSFESGLQYLENKAHYYILRKHALKKRDLLVQKKGYSVTGKTEIKRIKEYASATFGSSSFWPWLAFYAEIRGEFIPGWIPEDYYRVHLLKKYNRDSVSSISGYKSLNQTVFNDFAFENLIFSLSGTVYSADRKKITISRAVEILQQYNDDVIIKPELGFGGRKIQFKHSANIDIKELIKNQDVVIQPVCEQHPVLKSLFPHSLNTIRVFTMLDEMGEAHTKYYYLRFGTGSSKIDNTSSGGGYCQIHPDGKLDTHFYNDFGISCGTHHPDTNVALSNVLIPNFNTLLKKCKQAHESFPYVKFIGWDVAVDRHENSVLIEWNARYPIIWSAEALFGPLWDKIPQ